MPCALIRHRASLGIGVSGLFVCNVSHCNCLKGASQIAARSNLRFCRQVHGCGAIMVENARKTMFKMASVCSHMAKNAWFDHQTIVKHCIGMLPYCQKCLIWSSKMHRFDNQNSFKNCIGMLPYGKKMLDLIIKQCSKIAQVCYHMAKNAWFDHQNMFKNGIGMQPYGQKCLIWSSMFNNGIGMQPYSQASLLWSSKHWVKLRRYASM